MTAADAALLLQARLLARLAQGPEPHRVSLPVALHWWLDLDVTPFDEDCLPGCCLSLSTSGTGTVGRVLRRVDSPDKPTLAVLSRLTARLGRDALVRRLRGTGDLPPGFLT